MSTVLTIRQAIVDGYETLTIGGDAVTASATKSDGNYDGSLPIAIVEAGTATLNKTNLSANAYAIDRLYYVKLYISKADKNDRPSVIQAQIDAGLAGMETVEDYFMLTDDRLGNTNAVISSVITRDAGDFYEWSEDTTGYYGLYIEHLVTYRRTKTTT